MSRDILYTPARAERAWECKPRCPGRPWKFASSGCNSWWPPPGGRSHSARCVRVWHIASTGSLWLRRYQQQRVAGIAERSCRPHHSPRLTTGELEEQVVEVRQRYPDWGARKLRVLLHGQRVSLTHSTIQRILLRRGLVHPDDRHPPAVERFDAASPMSCGRWTSKADWAGRRRSVHCRCWTITAATWWGLLQALGSARVEWVREQLESGFCRCGCRRRC